MFNKTGNNYAYAGLTFPISSANINGTGLMLNERVDLVANTKHAILNTANSNLDGSGTLVTLIGGNSSGTIVKRITIKAQGSTSKGMVRIFFYAGSSWLMREIEVPAITQSGTVKTFIAVINDIFYLKPSYYLKASTQVGDTIIVTAEGLDMSYPA